MIAWEGKPSPRPRVTRAIVIREAWLLAGFAVLAGVGVFVWFAIAP